MGNKKHTSEKLISMFSSHGLERTTILLASLTFVGYLLSYGYNAGLYEYYGLPLFVLKVDLENILIALFVLAPWMLAIPIVSYYLITYFSQRNKGNYIYGALITLMVLAMTVILFYYFSPMRDILLRNSILLACASWLLFLVLVWKMFLGKPPEEYKNPWLLITLAFGYLLVFLALIGLLGYIVASRGGIIFTYTDEKNNFYIVPSSINDQKVAIQGILIEKNNKAEACLTNNVKFLPSKQENFLKTERIDCIQWTCSDSPSILFKCPNFRPIMSDQP